MPPHLHGQHAAPPERQPLRNAEKLGPWHEPPRIRRRTYRRTLWPYIAAVSVLVALLSLYATTLPFHDRPQAVQIARGAGR